MFWEDLFGSAEACAELGRYSLYLSFNNFQPFGGWSDYEYFETYRPVPVCNYPGMEVFKNWYLNVLILIHFSLLFLLRIISSFRSHLFPHLDIVWFSHDYTCIIICKPMNSQIVSPYRHLNLPHNLSFSQPIATFCLMTTGKTNGNPRAVKVRSPIGITISVLSNATPLSLRKMSSLIKSRR